MALLKILSDGDETLRRKCRPVTQINERIITLLDDMTETMRRANGCGLAAPQVGVLRRIAVVEVEPGEVIELINPEIIKADGSQNEQEGCLSIPGRWGITERPMSVTVRAANRNGEIFTVKGKELLARALCHEIDHLDGILFTDKMIRELTEEDFE